MVFLPIPFEEVFDVDKETKGADGNRVAPRRVLASHVCAVPTYYLSSFPSSISSYLRTSPTARTVVVHFGGSCGPLLNGRLVLYPSFASGRPVYHVYWNT